MIHLIFCLLSLGQAADFFDLACKRYLVLPNPQTLEFETTDDLDLLAKVLKARAYLYGHPLDRVWAAFILNELEMRRIVEGQPLDGVKAPR